MTTLAVCPATMAKLAEPAQLVEPSVLTAEMVI